MEPLPHSATRAMIQAWDMVFSVRAPGRGYPDTLAFKYPFREPIQSALILFTHIGYQLTEAQFQALARTAGEVSPGMCFVSTYEDEWDFLESAEVRGDPRHYKLAMSDSFEDYTRTVPWPLENAMYAETGEWGAIISHMDHWILGGSRDFITTFKRHYPSWLTDAEELAKYWDSRGMGSWGREFIAALSAREA